MNSNMLSTNSEMNTNTDQAYGSNRFNYLLFTASLCTNEQLYNSGKLIEKTHKKISYDVAQEFPTDKFASVLKATMTEIPQVHAKPLIFKYNQLPTGVEFSLSNMEENNTTNINAGILKNLMKKYDHDAYVGVHGNFGLKNNPNTVKANATWTDFPSLLAAIVAKRSDLRDSTGTNNSNLTLSYTSGIAPLIDRLEPGANISNREKLKITCPNIYLKKLPQNLESVGDHFILSQDDQLVFHRASLPEQYAQEAGKYGLSTESLYTYESAGVEVETKGAIQFITKA